MRPATIGYSPETDGVKSHSLFESTVSVNTDPRQRVVVTDSQLTTKAIGLTLELEVSHAAKDTRHESVAQSRTDVRRVRPERVGSRRSLVSDRVLLARLVVTFF